MSRPPAGGQLGCVSHRGAFRPRVGTAMGQGQERLVDPCAMGPHSGASITQKGDEIQQYKIRVRHEYGHPRLRTIAWLALVGGIAFVWITPNAAAHAARSALGLLFGVLSAFAKFVVDVVA